MFFRKTTNETKTKDSFVLGDVVLSGEIKTKEGFVYFLILFSGWFCSLFLVPLISCIFISEMDMVVFLLF